LIEIVCPENTLCLSLRYIDTIYFDKDFTGNWMDNEKGEWRIKSFNNAMQADFEKDVQVFKINSKDIDISILNNAYSIEYIKKNKSVEFIGMPFLLEGQMFVDFMPFEYDDDGTNGLARSHLIETHSLAKINKLDNGGIHIDWLAEERLNELFNEKAIQIKHEKLGFYGEGFVLTASSKELQTFLKKYIKSSNPDKWKTSTKYTLTKADAQP